MACDCDLPIKKQICISLQGSCSHVSTLVILSDIAPNAPIRLSVAAKLAFPDGTMTASGLRREAARGRLIVERIAGKDFTTLNHIAQMREQCRVQAKEPDFISAERDTAGEDSLLRPYGSSEMAARISPQDALRARLKQSRPQKQSKP